VQAALEQDLNTPAAIARLHELAGRLNKAESQPERMQLKRGLLAGGAVLGLLQADPEAWMKGGARPRQPVELVAESPLAEAAIAPSAEAEAAGDAWVDERIEERKAARKAKDFGKADEIRAELAERGILLEDKPGGVTEWRRAE
jgi:cysteinyl-tRNA synthetase